METTGAGGGASGAPMAMALRVGVREVEEASHGGGVGGRRGGDGVADAQELVGGGRQMVLRLLLLLLRERARRRGVHGRELAAAGAVGIVSDAAVEGGPWGRAAVVVVIVAARV